MYINSLILVLVNQEFYHIMSTPRVNLKVQRKKNPRDLSAPDRYYVQAVKTGTCDLERPAYLIVNQSTVSEADCLAVLHSFVHNMMDELEQGRVVELGHLGNFQIKVSSLPSNSPEEVGIENVKSIGVNYRPSLRIKKRLKKIKFKLQK